MTLLPFRAAPRRPVAMAAPIAIALSLALSVLPNAALACACGCSIFNVTGAGDGLTNFAATPFSIYLRYGYINQDINLAGSSRIERGKNHDSQVNTSFYIVGGNWRADPDWSFNLEVPIIARQLSTRDEGDVFAEEDTPYTARQTGFGDVSALVTYTGLADNYTTGLSLGIKLPSGDFHGPTGPLGGAEFDADTRLGTGSTDVIIGAYHSGRLTGDGRVGYYVQGRGQIAFASQNEYRPGNEFNVATGVNYGFTEATGPFSAITPVLSLIGGYRQRDDGANADPANTGFERVLIAPGVELRRGPVRVFGDIEVPIYQRMNAAADGEGDSRGQLVAGVLFKLQVNYDF